MVNILTEEKFRKLASLDKKKASSMWQFYLSGEGKEREEAEVYVVKGMCSKVDIF
jgi:hypothetical protein